MTNNVIATGGTHKLKSMTFEIEAKPVFLKYTCNASGQLPTFNEEFTSDCYEATEVDNNNGTWTTTIKATKLSLGGPKHYTFKDIGQTLLSVEYISLTEFLEGANSMFFNCNFVEHIDLSNFKDNNITNMRKMFANCINLKFLDVSNLNTENVTDMNSMFTNCNKINIIGLEKWDTRNVTTIESIFNCCHKLNSIDLNSWNTSKMTNMKWSFNGCYILSELNLSNWDTTNVTNMYGMFSGCHALTTLNLNKWDTSNVTDMSMIFSGCNTLKTLNINKWNTGNVTSVQKMFWNCFKLTELDVSNFDTSSVTSMYDMFAGCQLLTSINVNNWDTSNVKDISYMFYDCTKLTSLDLSNWNTSNVTNMQSMFYTCRSLTSITFGNNFDTINVTNMGYTFHECNSLTSLDLSNFNTSKVTDMEYMFNGCRNLAGLDLSTFDVNNVTTMKSMFNDCVKLTSIIGLENWNVENVTNMQNMFRACKELASLNISKWNPIKVERTHCMFGFLTIEELDLSGWKTPMLWFMTLMFYNSDFKTIKLGEGFNTSKVDELGSLFMYCNSLEKIIGLENFDTSNISNINNIFNSCKSLTSLNLSNWNTDKVTNMNDIFKDMNSLNYLDISNIKYNNLKIMALETLIAPKYLYLNDSDCITFMSKFLNTRTEPGYIYAKDISGITQATIDTLAQKNYTIHEQEETVVAIYTFDSNINDNVIPAMDGLDETACINVEDSIDSNGIVTRALNVLGGIPTGFHFYSSALLSVINIKLDTVTDMSEMFKDCINLTSIHSDSECQPLNVERMFGGCALLKDFSIYDIDFTALTNYEGMFEGCTSLDTIRMRKVNESVFNNVILADPVNTVSSEEKIIITTDEISETLMASLSNKGWALKNVVAYYKFDSELYENYLPEFNEDFEYDIFDYVDISDNITYRFIETNNIFPTIIEFGGHNNKYQESKHLSLLNIYDFNGRALIDTKGMFANLKNVIKIKGKNIDANDMYQMFYHCNKVKSIEINNFITNRVENMTSLFCGCEQLQNLNDVIKSFDTSKVTKMFEAFGGCSQVTDLDLSHFDVSKLSGSGLQSTFSECINLNTLNLTGWTSPSVTSLYCTFYNCKNLTSLDLSDWNISNVTTMRDMFKNCSSLTSITFGSNWDTSKVTNIRGLFYNCNSLTSLDVSNWDTSKVETMESVFYGCHQLKLKGVEQWNVENCDQFTYTFYKCYAIETLNLSGWSLKKASGYYRMFGGLTSLKILIPPKWRQFNSNGSASFYRMFEDCESLEYLDFKDFDLNCDSKGSADIDSLYSDNGFLQSCHNLKYIRWNLEYSIKKASPVFPDRSSKDEKGKLITNCELDEETLTTLTNKGWEIISPESVLKKVAEYIYDPDVWASPLPVFNDSFVDYFIDDEEIEGEAADGTVKTLVKRTIWSLGELPTRITSHYAWGVNSITNKEKSILEILYLDTSNAIKLNFAGLGYLKVIHNVNDLDVSKVQNMEYLFTFCGSLTELDLNNWDVSNVSYITYPFMNMGKIEKINLSNWNINNPSLGSSFQHMFQGTSSLKEVNMSNWFKSPFLKSTYSMFNGCVSLEKIIGIENFNTSELINVGYMFQMCRSLTELDLSNWDTSKVTGTASMFNDCPSLTSLDVSNWDTSKVTGMQDMFKNCKSLTSLDLSNWDTSKVNNMASMFNGCQSLTELDLNNFDTSKVTNMNHMFSGCNKLTLLNVSNFNTSNVIDMQSMFSNCHTLKSLDVSNWDTKKVTAAHWMFINSRFENIDTSNWTAIPEGSYLFYGCRHLKYLDLSNCKDIKNYDIFSENDALTDIGMVHCSVKDINKVASDLDTNRHTTIWIGTHLTTDEIASLDQYDHITYSVQEEQAAKLLLSSPLLEGDEIKVIDGQLCHVHNMCMITLDENTPHISDTTNSTTSYYKRYSLNTSIMLKYQGKITCDNYYCTNEVIDASLPWKALSNGTYQDDTTNTVPLYIGIERSIAPTEEDLKNWLAANPLTVIAELAEPWIEVINPNNNLNLTLYENGSLYKSDPTASITQTESNTNFIIESIVGDSVVNVNNLKNSIKLSEQMAQISTTEPIVESFNARPTFTGKTIVNIMNLISWYKISTDSDVGYQYDKKDLTDKTYTVSNFCDRPLKIVLNTIADGLETEIIDIAANETKAINISNELYISKVYGLLDDGWEENNLLEMKHINIIEGEEAPNFFVSNLKNTFEDNYDTECNKYKVRLCVSNSPYQFGKGGTN